MQSCPSTVHSAVPLSSPKFARVNRAATASLGFPSNLDSRTVGPTSLCESGDEAVSLADRAASRLRTEAQASAARNLKLATEDMIYSKNNVCVHSSSSSSSSSGSNAKGRPAPGRADPVHVPGYLSLRCRGPSILGVGSSLILHWIPNHFITNAAYGYGEIAPDPSPAHSAPKARSASAASDGKRNRTASSGSGGSNSGGDALPRDVSTFTIDLGQMRSVKVFFNMDDRTSGQLVVASANKQFRVLHFHHGGLPGLQKALDDWPMSSQAVRRNEEVSESPPRSITFNICRTHLDEDGCHPEEGMYCALTLDAWFGFMDPDGRVTNEPLIRKIIFFGGITPDARRIVWPFLLNYYAFDSTHEERAAIRDDYRTVYQAMKKKREAMDSAERQQFWQKVQCTVEKDVVRTDRSQLFFAGEKNPNTAMLQEILLCYAVREPDIGYTQGMSDLLAPLLAAVRDEVDAFACFVGLMRFSVLVHDGQSSMHRQLELMREMMVIQLPTFYSYLTRTAGGSDLLFCHRWLLLSFKREFPHAEALRVWEACWASQPHFPFTAFLCMAVMAVYGSEVVERRLPVDETLLHFSKLSQQMSVEVVLHQARALVHQLAALNPVPCRVAALLPQLQAGAFELSGVKKSTWRFACEECRGDGPCHRRYAS